MAKANASPKSTPSPEATVAAALRAAAAGLIATAAALNSLADAYVPEGGADAKGAAVPATTTAAPANAPVPSLDTLKAALIKLIDHDSGNRTRLEQIIAKVTGSVRKIAEIPEGQRAEVIQLAEAAMATKAAVTGDDL